MVGGEGGEKRVQGPKESLRFSRLVRCLLFLSCTVLVKGTRQKGANTNCPYQQHNWRNK